MQILPNGLRSSDALTVFHIIVRTIKHALPLKGASMYDVHTRGRWRVRKYPSIAVKQYTDFAGRGVQKSQKCVDVIYRSTLGMSGDTSLRLLH